MSTQVLPGPFLIGTKGTVGQAAHSCGAGAALPGSGECCGVPGDAQGPGQWLLSGVLPESCSHELSNGFASSRSSLLSGFCSLSSCALFSQTCHCFGTFLPPLLSLLKKPISVPGECWWEELGTLQASSAWCKSKIFFRK